MIGKSILFILILFFAGIPIRSVEAQVSVTASIEPGQVTLEDELLLTVSVKGARKGSEPVLPSMPAFKAVGAGTTSSLQIINGRVDSKMEYTYFLIPQEEGTHTIGPISVFSEGREYKSEPLTVVVTGSGIPSGQVPQTGGFPGNQGLGAPGREPDQEAVDGSPREPRDYWISTMVAKKNPFVNEEVLFTFRFFTRVRVEDVVLTLPEFKEFWSEEVVPEKKYYKEIGGDRFVVSEKVIALYPLSSGAMTIDATTLKLKVPEGSGNPFFNDPFFNIGSTRTKSKNLRSDEIGLEVSPLPENPPADFSHLVGQFGLNVSLSEDHIKEGDTAILTIRIEGKGNLRDAILPSELTFDSFKVYTNKPTSETLRSESGIHGNKVFTMHLVPTKAGDFSLPPVHLSFFDPDTGHYESLEGPRLDLHVDPSAGETLNPANGNDEPQPVPLTIPEDIATIHTDPQILEKVQGPLRISLRLFLFLLIPPLVTGLCGLYQWRLLAVGNKGSQKSPLKRFRKSMNQIRRDRLTTNNLLNDLHVALVEYFGDKFCIFGRSLTFDDIGGLLAQKGTDFVLNEKIKLLLFRLETGRFASQREAALPEQIVDEALTLIEEIDKKIKK